MHMYEVNFVCRVYNLEDCGCIMKLAKCIFVVRKEHAV